MRNIKILLKRKNQLHAKGNDTKQMKDKNPSVV